MLALAMTGLGCFGYLVGKDCCCSSTEEWNFCLPVRAMLDLFHNMALWVSVEHYGFLARQFYLLAYDFVCTILPITLWFRLHYFDCYFLGLPHGFVKQYWKFFGTLNSLVLDDKAEDDNH